MRGSRRVLLLLLLLVVVLLLLVVVLVSLGGGGRALLGKRRRGESSSSSSGRRSSGGAAAVVAAVAAAAAAPAPSSAAGAVPPRRTAAQQDQVSRESVPVSDSDDVADADVAPGRGRERGAAENVDGAGVHLLGLSFLNLFFLFLGKGREILSGGDAEGAKGKKMGFISLSPARVAPKKKRKPSLCHLSLGNDAVFFPAPFQYLSPSGPSSPSSRPRTPPWPATPRSPARAGRCLSRARRARRE